MCVKNIMPLAGLKRVVFLFSFFLCPSNVAQKIKCNEPQERDTNEMRFSFRNVDKSVFSVALCSSLHFVGCAEVSLLFIQPHKAFFFKVITNNL